MKGKREPWVLTHASASRPRHWTAGWWAALGLFCLSFTPIGAGPARAQISLNVVPMTVEADVQSGSSYTASVRVQSEPSGQPTAGSHLPMRIKVSVLDWTLTLDGTPQFVAPGTFPGSCSRWVQVNPAEFDLKQGQVQEVRYTLTVPPDARGTYRTILMFEPGRPPARSRREGMTIVGRVGSIIYATVGPHHKSGQISQFGATATGMSLTLENKGDDHLRLTGAVQVKDQTGKVVREEKLPASVVLPRHDNRRQLRLNWSKSLPAGNYTITAILDYGGEELLGAETPITVP
jgi:P pilus assembly chaperone PapD